LQLLKHETANFPNQVFRIEEYKLHRIFNRLTSWQIGTISVFDWTFWTHLRTDL